jgi:outer membrane protein
MFHSIRRSGAARAALFALLLSGFAGAASAQVKVAVINTQKAMADTEELKKASAAVEAKYKPRQDELAKLQADLQSIEQQLNSGKLNQNAAAELQTQGQRKQRDAQRISDDLQADFERDRTDILGKASQKMQTVIQKLAEEKGVDVIVDASQTLFFKPALDLTADATAAYNKANPAK